MKIYENDPFSAYKILDTETLGQATMEAMRIVNDFQDHPCKLDVQWFMHLLEFPSVQDLMSEQSLEIISTRADEI